MKLSVSQREFAADKLMDTANYALAGLVFAQVFANRVRVWWALLGILLYAWCWSIALRWRKGVRS